MANNDKASIVHRLVLIIGYNRTSSRTAVAGVSVQS